MAIFKRNPKGLLNSGKIHRYDPQKFPCGQGNILINLMGMVLVK